MCTRSLYNRLLIMSGKNGIVCIEKDRYNYIIFFFTTRIKIKFAKLSLIFEYSVSQIWERIEAKFKRFTVFMYTKNLFYEFLS